MQAPGGPEEDTSGDFRYGGWMVPHVHEVGRQEMLGQMKSSDLLLGRKTFDIWAAFWPAHAEYWPGINEVTKYVLSTTLETSPWKNSVVLKRLADIETLKNSEGSGLQVWGSGELVQFLLKKDLVDEFWLRIAPLTLGAGKKLFDAGTIPAALTLTKSLVTPTGAIFAYYRRAGEVKIGTMGT